MKNKSMFEKPKVKPLVEEVDERVTAAKEALASCKAELSAFTKELKGKYGANWRNPTDADELPRLIKLESSQRKLMKELVKVEAKVAEEAEAAEEAALLAEIERKEKLKAKFAKLGK